jgi:hypothetical protein
MVGLATTDRAKQRTVNELSPHDYSNDSNMCAAVCRRMGSRGAFHRAGKCWLLSGHAKHISCVLSGTECPGLNQPLAICCSIAKTADIVPGRGEKGGGWNSEVLVGVHATLG